MSFIKCPKDIKTAVPIHHEWKQEAPELKSNRFSLSNFASVFE